MKNIKCYVDGKSFAIIPLDDNNVNNLSSVKYAMELEIKENGATRASYHIPGLIYGDYEYVNGKWVCKDR